MRGFNDIEKMGVTDWTQKLRKAKTCPQEIKKFPEQQSKPIELSPVIKKRPNA